MEAEFKNIAIEELNKARDTWKYLPHWVYTSEYESALLDWIGQCVDNGRTNIKRLVLYTLDHETGCDKEAYFPFNRKDRYRGRK